MQKIGKILGIAMAILITTVLALAVLSRILITPERVKEVILPIVEDTLHRKVSLEDVRVGLFSGIILKNLVIQDRTGSEPFAVIDNFILRYRFWPLLTLQVIIDEILLEKPRIRVVRFPDGELNFSDLLNNNKDNPVNQKTADRSGESLISKRLVPLNLLISKIYVKNGEFVFLDLSLKAVKPTQYKLTDVEIKARSISLFSAFPVEFKARLDDSLLSFEGNGNLRTLEGKGKLLLSNLDITAFAPYIQDRLPGKLSSVKLSIDAKIEGDPQKISARGNIAIQKLNLTLDAFKDYPLQDANLVLAYILRAEPGADSMEFSEVKAYFNGLPVNFSGKVEGITGYPSVDITMHLPDLDISSALSSISKNLAGRLDGFKLDGSINARLHLLGRLSKPDLLLQDGEVNLARVQAGQGDGRPTINGVLRLKGNTVTSEKLTVRIGKEQADIDLTATNLFGNPLTISSRFTSDRFALDPLLNLTAAPAVAVHEVKAAEPSQPPLKTESGPLNLPLRLTGDVQVGQLLYRDLTIANFNLNYTLENNILRVDRMTGNLLGGRFVQTARVNLGTRGFSYTNQFTLADIRTDQLVSAFSPRNSGIAFGTLNLHADLKGDGTTPESIRKNLVGRGDFQLRDVKLTGGGVTQSLADYLNLEELRIMRFSQGNGRFSIADGRVNLNSQFSGSDVRMAPEGYITLEGSLDIALNTRLSPELTRKLGRQGRITQFFTDEQGWGYVPLKFTGTVNEPGLSLDIDAAQKMAREKVIDKLQQKLQDLIFDKKMPPQKPGQSTQEPGPKSLKDIFKGLFGK